MKRATSILTIFLLIACAALSRVCQAQWMQGSYSVDSIHSTESYSGDGNSGHSSTTPTVYADTTGGNASSDIIYIRTYTWDTFSDYPYCEGFSVKPSGSIYGYVDYNDNNSCIAASWVTPSGGSNGYSLNGVTNYEPPLTTYANSQFSNWTAYSVATLGAYSASTTIECYASCVGNEAHATASAGIDFP